MTLAALVGGCGSAAGGSAATAPGDGGSAGLAHWTTFAHAKTPLDVVGARRDGALVMAAAGRLFLVRPNRRITAYAPAYQSPGGEEPYIALSPGGCFGNQTVYALRLTQGPGVTAVTSAGQVRRFASINAPGLLDGITFGWGKLLVTINHGTTTTVDALDCQGHVRAVTRTAPKVEGGIAVAPSTFGRFAGDLIAPDENGGRVFALTPGGRSFLVANSGLPHGGDVGVESEGFAPSGRYRAVTADRLTPGNPHPGDDTLLVLSSAALSQQGVRAGDLLVATEGGDRVDAISCTRTACTVRHVADGPSEAHGEGHIAFLRG